jgi:hypothetical protein
VKEPFEWFLLKVRHGVIESVAVAGLCWFTMLAAGMMPTIPDMQKEAPWLTDADATASLP